MSVKIPVKLNKEPLLEVIWEVRYSDAKPSSAELLPGLIYQKFSRKYGNIVKLPLADLPASITEGDPNLKYSPRIRLENENQIVQIGNHAISLASHKPYPGWEKFSSDIKELVEAIQSTGLIGGLERFSFKCINLIQITDAPGLSCLNVAVDIALKKIEKQPIQVKTEFVEDDLIHILQLISPAKVMIKGEVDHLEGVVVDVDTIKNLTDDKSWDGVIKSLDRVHNACKGLFFSLLKEETIKELEPEY